MRAGAISTKSRQSSSAGVSTLVNFEMRKSRSWSFVMSEGWRAEARLSGGESLRNHHGAAALWAKP